jgi:Ser/Thr protein kinase RdoA (MazF antagonist)
VAIALDSIPRFRASEARALALREYGITGAISVLPSERDQNFLIRDAVRGKIVLKIANRDDSPELLDFQHQAMRRVAAGRVDCRVQEVVPSNSGSDIGAVAAAGGARHCFRALTWIEGAVLGDDGTVRSAPLLESLGGCAAQVDLALRGFTHPAMHRVLQWDLRHADLAFDKAALLPDPTRRWVQRSFDEWCEINWSELRSGVIHGDFNDHNVLVEGGCVSGLLDFGDMVHSAVVCELAVALAYAILRDDNPLAAAACVIRGYHRENPLTEPEQRTLMPLMRARLAMSLCYSAHNRARNPGDAYQTISEAAVLKLLEILSQDTAQAAFEAVRGACAEASCNSPVALCT